MIRTLFFRVLPTIALLTIFDAEALASETSVDSTQSTAVAESCFPACRSGFLCHKAECVSICNPACAKGETCTNAGECVVAHPANAPIVGEDAVASPSSKPLTQEPAPQIHSRREHVNSEGMIIAGASLGGLGGMMALFGLPLLAVGDSARCRDDIDGQRVCDGPDFRKTATILTLSGVGLIAVGLPLVIIGAKRVPNEPESAHVTVNFGPGAVNLNGSF